jgi:hypothetical protein
MANATDAQVQNYVNGRVRPFAEKTRSLVIAITDNIGAIDDVYAALTVGSPTWADNRTDGPPHLLAPSDVLAINAFWVDIKAAMLAHGSYPAVLKACVRPPDIVS